MNEFGVVLHSDAYVSPFVERVLNKSKATFVIWISQSNDSRDIRDKFPQIKQYHYGEKDFGGMFINNPDSQIPLVFFDIFLLPTINMMTYCRKYRFSFLFIQHGVFSDLTAAKRIKKMPISWYLLSIGQAFKFLSQHGFTLVNVKLLMSVMINGSWVQRDRLKKYIVTFDRAVFWSHADALTLTTEFPDSFRSIELCEGPDKSLLNLEYSKDGSVIFITQPFVEDKIVSEEKYVAFIKELMNKYGDKLIILRHPRLSIVPDIGVYLKNLDNVTIKTVKVIGHYSSLLLAVPSSIPIEVEDFSIPSIKTASDEVLKRINEKPLEDYKSIDEVITSLNCA